MSKIKKFAEHPEWFFRDAFKKREANIANKLISLNDQLKKIGIPIELNMQFIEQTFVNTAITLSYDNIISDQVIKLMGIEPHSRKKIEYSKRQKIAYNGTRFRGLFKRFNPSVVNVLDKSNDQELVVSLDKLSPEAKTIYFRLNYQVLNSGKT